MGTQEGPNFCTSMALVCSEWWTAPDAKKCFQTAKLQSGAKFCLLSTRFAKSDTGVFWPNRVVDQFSDMCWVPLFSWRQLPPAGFSASALCTCISGRRCKCPSPVVRIPIMQACASDEQLFHEQEPETERQFKNVSSPRRKVEFLHFPFRFHWSAPQTFFRSVFVKEQRLKQK